MASDCYMRIKPVIFLSSSKNFPGLLGGNIRAIESKFYLYPSYIPENSIAEMTSNFLVSSGII